MRKLKVLIACEESQEVCKSFRALGHESYSCDILPCSGGHPEWHYKQDVIPLVLHENWDIIIAHPPCTYLCNSGVRWLKGNPERWENMLDGAQFFINIKSWAEKRQTPIAIENPIPHKHTGLPRYNQLIQPYQFGHLEKKATCLWLSGLPPLISTNNVFDEMMKLKYKDRAKVHYASPGPDRAKIRSKTYPGIAKAMAEQWSNYILNK